MLKVLYTGLDCKRGVNLNFKVCAFILLAQKIKLHNIFLVILDL